MKRSLLGLSLLLFSLISRRGQEAGDGSPSGGDRRENAG